MTSGEKKRLVQFIPPAPNAGTRKHLSCAAAETAIELGFAIEVPEDDALNQSRCNAHRPAGWSLVRAGQFGDKLFMRLDDGSGGHQLFDKAPEAQRVWIFNPETDVEGRYEYRQLVQIPAEVVAEFQRLGGGQLVDHEAAGIVYRDKLARQQHTQDSQNRTADVRRFMGKAQ